jgi:hypothetical protein
MVTGPFGSSGSRPVPCLSFADDLVLLSSTRAGLQAMACFSGTLSRALLTEDGADREHEQDEGCRLWGAAADGQKGAGDLVLVLTEVLLRQWDHTYNTLEWRYPPWAGERQQFRLSVRQAFGLPMPYDIERCTEMNSCIIRGCGLSCLTVL